MVATANANIDPRKKSGIWDRLYLGFSEADAAEVILGLRGAGAEGRSDGKGALIHVQR